MSQPTRTARAGAGSWLRWGTVFLLVAAAAGQGLIDDDMASPGASRVRGAADAPGRFDGMIATGTLGMRG